jgi:outer membrane protein insertion porin family
MNLRKLFLTFFFSILILTAGISNAAVIDLVTIEGNRKVPSSTFLRYTVKAGEEFDMSKISDSIKSIFATELVSDVQVDMRVDDDKLVIAYIITERPYVNRVYLEGNVKMKERYILEDMIPMEGMIFDRAKVEENVTKIINVYNDEKYYSASIVADVEARNDNMVDIFYRIDEGPEARVYEIVFPGNEFFTQKQLLKMLHTKEKGFWSWITGSGKLKKEMVAADVEKIKSEYFKKGYINARVGEPTVTVGDNKKKLVLSFPINEGDRYKIDQVSFSGNKHRTNEELEAVTLLKQDDWFNLEEFQNDIKRLTDRFTDIGYAFANVEPLTDVRESTKTVNITYRVEENILVKINRINIRGNADTKDRVIRRELDIAEGDLYSSAKIRSSKRNIEYTDFFEEVRLDERRVDEESLNLDVSVKDKRTGFFSVGMGYSTLDQVVGMFRLQKNNLLGSGYSADIKTEISNKRTDYTVSLTNPWLFDKPITLGFDLYNLKRSYYEYTKKSEGAAIRLGHRILGRKVYASYRLAYEDIDIYDLDDDASWYVQQDQGKFTTVSFTPSLNYRTTNHPVDPTEGNYSRIYYKYAGGILGGDRDYSKIGIETTQYVPIGRTKLVGVFHIEGGWLEPKDGQNLPTDERFRLGGMNSVRGYKYGDISPKDTNGNDYGGDKMFVFNTELVFPIAADQGFKGVLFYDVGQVNDDHESFLSGDFYQGVGIGFRWYSPMGPIRIEYGIPLDAVDGSKKSGRWEFSMGGMF